ncbi:twin-arginine translocase TatA/TatE family subunit [Bdellovibrio sp. SKB1291214]|uniref:Sec-independent protein translocase subunit TatA/TatB n=1 Tax=Bdellovibrio sp. SKB1291214 TaxID=1732569 RepID=UPI001C3DC401|nr:twin-arginine translocase TatA/TatE family subunit [Bdellovibrio sp. SKB1291214]UYL10596.1 twin-arginine translocase TatA/TatE family subunit [Bdellovibrio sp. SKB1291214]
MSEIIFLAILALIVIGPKELPEVARTLGRFLNELKRTTGDFTEDLKKQARVDHIDLFETPRKGPRSAPPANPSVSNDEEGDWSSPDHVPHGGAPTMHDSAHKREPVQMDLPEQKSTDDGGDNKGNKA